MRQEKKLDHYRKQNDGLRSLVDKLRKENETLKRDNDFLKATIEKNKNLLDQITDSFEDMRQEHLIEIGKLKDAREKYCSATQSVYALKKKYKREMEQYLKGISKRI